MPPTQISGSQINKRWLLAAGVAFTLVAAAAGVVFQTEDSGGNTTMKEFADGSREQSGSLLITLNGTTLWADAVNRLVGIRTRNPKTEFEVNGSMSGEALHVSRALSGAGLVDCDDPTGSKLLWNDATGRFSCGTDQNSGGGGSGFNSGSVITIGDGRYLLRSGGTLTGALVIQNGNTHTPTGTPLLTVRGTTSGTVLYASQSLRSSGSVLLEGLLSGATITGFGLSPDCDGASNKITWDASTQLFKCETDQTAGSGLGQTEADERYVNQSGDTMTGALAIIVTGGNNQTVALEIPHTASGRHLHAQDLLSTSGALAIEGSMYGAGLSQCTSTQKLEWNNGSFSCVTDDDNQNLFETIAVSGQSDVVADSATDTLTLAEGSNITITTTPGSDTVTIAATDTDTTYAAGEGLSLNGTTFSRLATITGTSLKILGTASGRVVHAEHQLQSSGSLVIEGLSFLNGNVTFGSTLTLGGVTYTFPASDGTASGKVLKTNGAGQLSWSNDLDTDSDTTYTAGQGLTLNGTSFQVNSTLTGSLARFQTLSGTTLYAKSSIASSGSIVLEGTLSGAVMYGFGLATDCDNATTSKLLWDAATGRFSCGTDTDTNTTYSAGQGLALNGGVFTLNGTISGTLLEFDTVSGSILHASSQLRSSGSLIVDGSSVIFGHSTFNDCAFLRTVANVLTCGTVLGLSNGGTNKALTAVNGGIVYSDADSLEITAKGNSGQVLISQGTGAPKFSSGTLLGALGLAGIGMNGAGVVTGTGGVTPIPIVHGIHLTDVLLDINEAPFGQALQVDILRNGTSIFSTKPEIDAGSRQDDNNHVFSATQLDPGDRLQFKIQQTGTDAAGHGTGLTILLQGYKTP